MSGVYTPDTASVRETYGIGWFADDDRYVCGSDPHAEFDRWLAAHDAEVWDEGYTAGQRDWDANFDGGVGETPNPYRGEK